MKVFKHILVGACILLAALATSCSSNRQAKVSPPTPPPVTTPTTIPPPLAEAAPPPMVPPPPVAAPAVPDPAQLQKAAEDVLATAENRFLDGKTKLQAGDVQGAKASFDAAVDLILSSGVDLRGNRRLKTIFDELFNQLYQLETVAAPEAKEEAAREKGKESPPDQKYEPAVADELENINVYPISIEPGLQHLVEEDIAHTKYDIPVIVNENVLRWLEYYKSRGRNIMELGLKRIGLYRDLIYRVFSELGVPKDLIYLAQQESMFKPRALSRARAKGMWQFVYGTGRRYGLEQNWWVDEKLDPEKSTRAAAQHLLTLYDMFGDWYLVMAAYNSGEFGIQRITEKTGIRDFWTLADRKLLYKQTVDYVPSILATMIIAKHPEKYGFSVEPLPPVVTKKVKIPSPVDLSVVAESTGLTLEDIRELNPELRHLVTPANLKFYEINLPVDKSEEGLKSLAALPVDKRVRWTRHLIQEGDSLWIISRHYHVSIEMIMDANNMSSDRIRAGRYLLIPPYPTPRPAPRVAAASKVVPKPATAAPANQTAAAAAKAPAKAPDKGSVQLLVSAPPSETGNGAGRGLLTASLSGPSAAGNGGQEAKRTVAAGFPKSGPEKASASADKKVIHTVKQGDTLYEIARKYNTTTDQVRKWNGLKTNLLHPGDTLLIFMPRS